MAGLSPYKLAGRDVLLFLRLCDDAAENLVRPQSEGHLPVVNLTFSSGSLTTSRLESSDCNSLHWRAWI